MQLSYPITQDVIIKAHRLACGLEAEEVADLCNIQRDVYVGYESNPDANIKDSDKKSIAKLFGILASDISNSIGHCTVKIDSSADQSDELDREIEKCTKFVDNRYHIMDLSNAMAIAVNDASKKRDAVLDYLITIAKDRGKMPDICFDCNNYHKRLKKAISIIAPINDQDRASIGNSSK